MFEGIWVCEVCVACARESVCNNERECVSRGEVARGPFPLVFAPYPGEKGPLLLLEGPRRAGPGGPNTAANPRRPLHVRFSKRGDRARACHG